MEKNLSGDMEESFEIYDPVVNSISDSMSIVPIPEPLPQQMTSSERSNIGSNSFNEIGNTSAVTKCVDSSDGLPNYDQIEQQFTAQQMSNISGNHLMADERNESLQKLSDKLNRIEDNEKNFPNDNTEQMVAKELKQLRDENEKLKAMLESGNLSLKGHLKNLHEWEAKKAKDNELMEQHKQMVQNSELLAQEIQRLNGENDRLKDEVTELKGMTGLVEQLTAEAQTLRTKCQLMANYEKLDVSSELQTQELHSRLVESQLKFDAMTNEMNALKRELSATKAKVDTLPAMESQLSLFEHDFKIEEMAKLAALKEVSELEKDIERLKMRNSELEERVDKGGPAVDLKDDSVGKHHRRSRHSGRLGRHAIPVPSVGAVLRGFKQFKTTSSNV